MLVKRPRRNRKLPSIRSLVEETVLLPSDLVVPFFLLPGSDQKQAIQTLPGIFRLSVDHVLKEVERLYAKGIQAVMLFPVVSTEHKDPYAQAALNENGVILHAIRALKQQFPSLCVMADIALDPFTSHGHDGLVNGEGQVMNDETVELLAKVALLYAQNGVDIVAPSDMMDGRVGAIRKLLDDHQFHDVGILSYTAKYASALYSPFREALGSFPKFGDKKGYQMNPANVREALLEAALDEEEGADMLMVKPALFYLDVIAKVREQTHLPVCAYHVSGEYSMVMAAHERGMLDAKKVFLEALISIKRAGASFIISYAIDHVLDNLISAPRESYSKETSHSAR
jgi:porphobilinogen synthase